jgi:glycine amidinotransferase/scyllo-inosamine-4-phosphate amidinotransferase 1
MRIQHFYKDKVENWLSHWIGYVDETVFDLNVVSIDENTVITNGHDIRIEKELKKYGVEMIPFDFRHKYFWDSGLHCVTLDLSRNGERESYV